MKSVAATRKNTEVSGNGFNGDFGMARMACELRTVHWRNRDRDLPQAVTSAVYSP
jgi:hypothetical protein